MTFYLKFCDVHVECISFLFSFFDEWKVFIFNFHILSNWLKLNLFKFSTQSRNNRREQRSSLILRARKGDQSISANRVQREHQFFPISFWSILIIRFWFISSFDQWMIGICTYMFTKVRKVWILVNHAFTSSLILLHWAISPPRNSIIPSFVVHAT